MATPPAGTGYLLMDANVLIDYQHSDLSIMARVSAHLGQLHVLSTVLQEVEGIDAAACAALGVVLVEPTLDQLLEAAATDGGRLSLVDRTCLIVSRDAGHACVTNDAALRRACAQQDVPVIWGLEVMLRLVEGGHLGHEDAERAARTIHRNNPVYIGRAVIDEFVRKLNGLRR